MFVEWHGNHHSTGIGNQIANQGTLLAHYRWQLLANPLRMPYKKRRMGCEAVFLVSQSVTPNRHCFGRHLPYAFTERVVRPAPDSEGVAQMTSTMTLWDLNCRTPIRPNGSSPVAWRICWCGSHRMRASKSPGP